MKTLVTAKAQKGTRAQRYRSGDVAVLVAHASVCP